MYDAAGNQFTGSIDEVAVFDFALTDAQLEAHVAAAMAAGGSYSAAVLADKPFGYWGFDESDAAAVNQGTRGASLNGTYNGQIDRNQPGPQEALAGFTADNKAISVEAPEEGFVRVDESILSGLTEFSMSGWVKPGFIEDNRVGLFGQNDAMEFGFINPTTIQMWTPQGGAANFTFIDEIQEDEWVHIAAIGDGEEIRIYVNGELAQVGGTPLAGGQPVDSYGDSDFPFNVGGGGIYDAGGNQFTGLLDEVAVYDKALTANQIRAQFEAALGGPAVPGDYNGNGELDTEDLDLQSAGIKSGDLAFDLGRRCQFRWRFQHDRPDHCLPSGQVRTGRDGWLDGRRFRWQYAFWHR